MKELNPATAMCLICINVTPWCPPKVNILPQLYLASTPRPGPERRQARPVRKQVEGRGDRNSNEQQLLLTKQPVSLLLYGYHVPDSGNLSEYRAKCCLWLMAGMTTIYTSGSSTIFSDFFKATVIIHIINSPILATAIRLKIIYYFTFMNSGL